MSVSYVSAKEASQHYNVTPITLRRWVREGRIKYKETNGGRYRYCITEPRKSGTEQNIIYARVSSSKQSADLNRQIKHLLKHYPEYTLVTDIGSGINFKRRGFQTILEQLFKRDIREVVVTYPDRFSRLGFDLFQWIFEQFGAKLTFINQKNTSPESELLSDVMEIFTVFTSRYYGRRKYKDKES